MYRIIRYKGSYINLYPRLTVNNSIENADFRIFEKASILCKHLHSTGIIRNQTTIANPNMQPKIRKKRKKSKKIYAEMLVVTDTSSSQHQANVKKLTYTDLKLLASTNLSLSELYKLKDIPKTNLSEQYTYNNLSDIGNFPNKIHVFEEKPTDFVLSISSQNNSTPTVTNNIGTGKEYNPLSVMPEIDANVVNLEFLSLDEMCDIHINGIEKNISSHFIKPEKLLEAEELESEELDYESIHNPTKLEEAKTFLPAEKKDFEFLKRLSKNQQLDKVYRGEVIVKTLAAYIETCCQLKNPQRGLNALNFHRARVKKCNNDYYPPIKNIDVYNSLLKGFSHKTDYQKLLLVLELAKEEQVQLNVQSYIAIFDCLGRLNHKDSHLRDIRTFAKEAKFQGFTFDRIMNEGVFSNNERNTILDTFKSANSSYEPAYDSPVVQYNNHLINHLNNTEQLSPSKATYRTNNGLFTPEMLKKNVEKQMSIEKIGFVKIDSIEVKGTIPKEAYKYRQILEDHYKMWDQSAVTAFQRDLSALAAKRNPLNMEPFLRCLPIKDYITIIIEEAKLLAQGSETYSPTVNMLYKDLGMKVYNRYLVLYKEKTGVLTKIENIHKNYCTHYAATHPELNVVPTEENNYNSRQVWQWLDYNLKGDGASIEMDHRPWVPTTLTFIGKFLYHIITHDLKVDVNAMRNVKNKNYLPAFYTIFRTQGRIVKEELKPHPTLCKLYRASVPQTLTFPTYELPMICPPLPWTSTNSGGYLVSSSELIRLPSIAMSQKQKVLEVGSQQIYSNLDALNKLAGVPWKVNQKILDVILEVFNSGGSSSLDIPEPPSSLPAPEAPTSDMDKSERYQLFRQKMQYKRKKAEMYSLWCDCLYRLSLANHFRNDIFWVPHNMDFRGRVYPLPPHLSHMGSDLARSMLVFAEGRPLGPKGLDWLKLHLINLTGLKKRDPISERIKFANENIDLILNSADYPLSGQRWWTKSDEPWQTLACCIEIANVIRSPDPEKYCCHFPIHQDGSCNGLQHYAALGRDSGGAFSVNLTPSEEPQDVYSAVVALVEQQRASDAENGLEIAKILDGFVKRKVIKQTVMTTVYGVTRFGARLQIAKQLKDIEDFPKESVWAASSYLTGRTFESLRTMFTSTKEIQDWFTECARLISAVGGQHVEWTTPLGLPVIQPYFKIKKLPNTPGYDVFHIDKYEKPNVMKHKNAFPPNFIHSLDSCHMMLTALHAERAGITFVSVHDCFWTHPSTVDIMNQICRKQFVALHSQPILEELSAFLSDRYSYNDGDFTDDGSVSDLTKKKLNRILRQLPKKGDFDINQVLNSVYFFS